MRATIAVAGRLNAIRIAPPVAPEAIFLRKSGLDRRIQLLRDIPKRFHTLRVVQVLAEDYFVWPDPQDLSVEELVARAEEVALVVRAPDLGDVSGACSPEPLENDIIDRDPRGSGRALTQHPPLRRHEQRTERIAPPRRVVGVGPPGHRGLVLVDQGLPRRLGWLRGRDGLRGRRRSGLRGGEWPSGQEQTADRRAGPLHSFIPASDLLFRAWALPAAPGAGFATGFSLFSSAVQMKVLATTLGEMDLPGGSVKAERLLSLALV